MEVSEGHMSFSYFMFGAFGFHDPDVEQGQEKVFISFSLHHNHDTVTKRPQGVATIGEEIREGKHHLFLCDLASLIHPTTSNAANFDADVLSRLSVCQETRNHLKQELHPFVLEMAKEAYDGGYQRLEIIVANIDDLITLVMSSHLPNSEVEVAQKIESCSTHEQAYDALDQLGSVADLFYVVEEADKLNSMDFYDDEVDKIEGMSSDNEELLSMSSDEEEEAY